MASAPFGTWPSPVSAALVAAGGIGVAGPAVRTASGGTEVWWSELRPAEGARVVLVRRLPGQQPTDVLQAPFSARTRVHEYGGGAWFLGADAVYFSNWEDQRLYRLSLSADASDSPAAPVAITPPPTIRHGWRFADGVESADGAWLIAVVEDHHQQVDEVADNDSREARNSLAVIRTDGAGEVEVIVEGSDFVSSPRISPDGRWLSWIRWNHPNMPWDGTELCAAPLFEGPRIGNVQVVAGGAAESVIGANWTADGRLVFSSDREDRWNLYQWMPGSRGPTAITSLRDSEVGYPPWIFGIQPWTELPDGRLAVIETVNAADRLALVERDGAVRTIASPYVGISGLTSTEAGELVAVAQTKIDLTSVVEVDAGGHRFDHRRADEIAVEAPWFSTAEAVSFPSAGGRGCHAFFYAPAGLEMVGPEGELPPLIVIGHGGPTAHASPALNLKIQYWTSRGFAVVDVNYGGSTGFGRSYRRLLDDSWGIVDVEDCIAAARYLADAGRVDPDRMAIRGGSAGGFTVLAALTSSEIFSAGTSLYGVADLEALALDTHKFESRYTDGLVGPYPEARAVYAERSPINHTDQLSCPLLVLQGTEDEIVPPNQAEAIVAALAEKGIAHAAIYFEGEQHGFRQAENIVRSLEAELWFYGQVFGFEPADDIAPIDGAVGL